MRVVSWRGPVVLGLLGVVLGVTAGVGSARAARPGGFADALIFDATTKELQAKAGEANLTFSFNFTNSAAEPAVIDSVRTSCGCTVARVPNLPWTVAPGEAGEFSVVLDARGKQGTVTKSVFVNSSLGMKALTIRAVIGGANSGMGGDDRLRNMQIALADRFAVFKGECVSCHAQPAAGKMGMGLYLAACGVCHDSHNRASMVPDLKNLDHPTDRDHWIRWITFGRHGSMMPAFSQAEGGILTERQVDSLVDYLTRAIRQPRAARAQTGPRALTPRLNPRLPPLPGQAPPGPGFAPAPTVFPGPVTQ